MLTQSDRDWMKANRRETTEGRTTEVALVYLIEGEADPYTGDVVVTEEVVITECVWSEFRFVSQPEYRVVDGVEVREGDVMTKFDVDIDLDAVKYVVRDDIRYVIVSANGLGIGENNRTVALIRRVR